MKTISVAAAAGCALLAVYRVRPVRRPPAPIRSSKPPKSVARAGFDYIYADADGASSTFPGPGSRTPALRPLIWIPSRPRRDSQHQCARRCGRHKTGYGVARSNPVAMFDTKTPRAGSKRFRWKAIRTASSQTLQSANLHPQPPRAKRDRDQRGRWLHRGHYRPRWRARTVLQPSSADRDKTLERMKRDIVKISRIRY